MFAVLDGCCTGWLLHWMVAALDARLSNTTYNAPIIAKDLPVDHALLPVDLITSLNVTPSIVMHWPRVGVRVCGCAGVQVCGVGVCGGRWEVGSWNSSTSVGCAYEVRGVAGCVCHNCTRCHTAQIALRTLELCLRKHGRDRGCWCAWWWQVACE